MANEKISPVLGQPADEKSFFGRTRELREAWDHLMNGASILLSAPRRVGKTSFSRKIIQEAKDKGWKTLYLDLQGQSKESDFVVLFDEEVQNARWVQTGKIGTLARNGVKGIKSLLKGVKTPVFEIKEDVWQTYGKIKRFIEKQGDCLIVVDELAVYLGHLKNYNKTSKENELSKEVELFLEWLRSCRQTPGTKVRWIFCSSVSIENFLSEHQLSGHLNDVQSVFVAEFSEEEAKEFISLLGIYAKMSLTPELIHCILEKVGWYLPYFIQLITDELKKLMDQGTPLSENAIHAAYANLLKNKRVFAPWKERLKEYGDLTNKACDVLKACALPKGASKDVLLATLSRNASDSEKIEAELNTLLQKLEYDGYLMSNKRGRWLFRCPLLRDFFGEPK